MTDRFGKLAAAGGVPGLLLASVAPVVVAAPLIVTFTAHAQEVVQALPDPASAQLAEALRILSRSPNSLPALIDAARASLQLNDVDAAEGFIDRARAIAPQDGAVLATQALLAVKRQQPAEAIELFDRAAAAGEPIDRFAAEHGLAYDLAGQGAQAQQRYRVALAQGDDAEVTRRLSLSQAISGDQSGSEATLLPLLQRRDIAAYRTRAFALAILGREDEAVSIAEAMLPARLALRMAPYLRNMRSLSPQQQAAAGILGVFPAVARMGQEGPLLTRRADLPATPAPSSQADARLVPSGQPLGQQVASGATSREAVLGADEELPAIAAAPPSPSVLPPPPPSPAPPPPAPSAEPVVVAVLDVPADVPAPQAQAPALAPAPVQAPSGQPQSALAQTVQSQTAPSQAGAPSAVQQPDTPLAFQPESQPVVEPEAPATLEEAFAGFTLPANAPAAAATAAGAVDLTRITIRREQRPPPPPPPAPPPPPPPPRHPSRIWVQVGTGQNVDAFRFDWRRMTRTAGTLLNGREPYRARWGQTNRLLVGPFASVAEANRMVTQLEEKGIDAFRFTSSLGEEVAELN
jgi:Flp pilus assembly protein TadD